MDESLRQAERAGEWDKLAAGLKRSGRVDEARRIVQDATRRDEPGALDLLESWFPIDPFAYSLVRDLRNIPTAKTRALFNLPEPPDDDWFRNAPEGGYQVHAGLASIILLGDGDPRLDRALVDFGGNAPPGVLDQVDEPLVKRWRWALGYDDFWPFVLSRARPDPEQALTLLGWLADTSDRWLALSILWLVGCYGDASARSKLRPWTEHPDPMVQGEARIALANLGEGQPPELSGGLPWRPSWIPADVFPAWLRYRGLCLALRSKISPHDWGESWCAEVRWIARFVLVDPNVFPWPLIDLLRSRVGDRLDYGEYDDDVLIVWEGRESELRSAVSECVAQAGLEERVVVVGVEPGPEATFAALDEATPPEWLDRSNLEFNF